MSIRSDYKPASAWQRRRRAARRHGLLVVTLSLISLFGGLLAYIRSTPPPQATLAEQPPPPAPVKSAAAPAAPASAATHTAAPHTAAVTASAAHTPVTPVAPEKPKYDFYTELPRRQVDVPQEKAAPTTAPSRKLPMRTQPPATPEHKRALPDDTKPQTAATRSTTPAYKRTSPSETDTRTRTAATRSTPPVQRSTASTGTTNRVVRQPTAVSPPALRPLPQTTVAAKIQ